MNDWLESWNETLQRLYWGNRLETWILSAVVGVLSYALLAIVAKWLTSRAKKQTASSDSMSWRHTVAEMYGDFSRIFLFSIAIYVASIPLTLRPQSEIVLSRLLILGGLWQAMRFGRVLLDLWLFRLLSARADDSAVKGTLSLIQTLAHGVLYVTIVLLGLNNLGVNITALVAGLGVGGIAVALAAQNILGDLFASLTIVLDKPFRVGDSIQVDTLSGTVEHIGLKTTRIRNVTGEEVVLPNANLLQSRIHNFRRMYQRRVVTVLGVTYDTSHAQLKEIPTLLSGIVGTIPDLRFDRAHFKNFGPSSLDFELVYWVQSPDFSDHVGAQNQLNLEIFRQFGEKKIDFAFPTQTVHVRGGTIG